MPVLHGEAGFVLLGIALGLAVYIRQVYVDSNIAYDQLKSGALEPRWRRGKQYTRDRLTNLEYVQQKLIVVTRLMFAYIIILSLRMLAEVVNAIPAEIVWRFKCAQIPESWLYYWDVALIGTLVIGLAFMWWVHHHSSVRERNYHEAMWADLDASPQSN